MLQYLAGLWLLKAQHMWKNNQSDGLGQERKASFENSRMLLWNKGNTTRDINAICGNS